MRNNGMRQSQRLRKTFTPAPHYDFFKMLSGMRPERFYDPMRSWPDAAPKEERFGRLLHQHPDPVGQARDALHLCELQKGSMSASVHHVVRQGLTRKNAGWQRGQFAMETGGGSVNDEIELLPMKIGVIDSHDISGTGKLPLQVIGFFLSTIGDSEYAGFTFQ